MPGAAVACRVEWVKRGRIEGLSSATGPPLSLGLWTGAWRGGRQRLAPHSCTPLSRLLQAMGMASVTLRSSYEGRSAYVHQELQGMLAW